MHKISRDVFPIQQFHNVDLRFIKNLASFIAVRLKVGDALALLGDLGSGKTTFSQFIINTLLPLEVVTSPTFNVVNVYTHEGMEIWHCDLYRLQKLHEISELGIEDILNYGVCVIEWPELAKNLIQFTLEVSIYHSENYLRNLIISGNQYWSKEFQYFSISHVD